MGLRMGKSYKYVAAAFLFLIIISLSLLQTVETGRFNLTDNSNDNIYVNLRLLYVPSTLTFNRDFVPDNLLEYGWSLFIDVDGNPSTGEDGYEVCISLMHCKSGQPYNETIIKGTQHNTWIFNETEGSWEYGHEISVKFDSFTNTIIMVASKTWEELSGINENSRFRFVTFFYAPDGKLYKDTTETFSIKDKVVTDPKGDVPYSFIDIVQGSVSTYYLALPTFTPYSLSAEEYMYVDKVPDAVSELLDFFGVKEIALSGRFSVKLSPADSVSRASVIVKLGYIPARDLDSLSLGISVPELKWTSKEFPLRREDSTFVADIEVSTWWPGNVLALATSILKGVKGAASKMAEKAFLPEVKIWLSGNEPIYVSAIIEKVVVVDKWGEEHSFKVNKEIETSFGKWLKKLPKSNRWVFASAYSPVGIAIVDPEGRIIGYYDGRTYNQIEGAYYSGIKAPVQLIIIPNTIKGQYRVVVQGLKNGTYGIYAGVVEKGKLINQVLKENVAAAPGTINSYTVSVEETNQSSTQSFTTTAVETPPITPSTTAGEQTLWSQHYPYIAIVTIFLITTLATSIYVWHKRKR